jgi:aminopeptidase
MTVWSKLGIVVVGALMLGTGAAGAQPRPPGPPAPPKIDHAALAERLVGTMANVKENEIVQIEGGAEQALLLEEIAIAVRKRGAHPVVMLAGSEPGTKKMIASVPEKYDTQVPTAALALAKLVNVIIIVDNAPDPATFAAVSPARRAARGKTFRPVQDIHERRNVRIVELGNGMTPAPWRARLLGLTDGELYKMFWDGVNADYASVEAKANAMKAMIGSGSELKVTHPNGTNITFKIKGRKVSASDGVISDADIKAKGANIRVWLPAGEVLVTPVPGTANGKIVDDRMTFDGKEVTGVTVDVKAGKITAINAKTGWDVVQGRYDAAGPGKTEVNVIDFGINPAVKQSGKFESWVGAGMVTITAGGNTWAGGTNKEPFTLELKLTGTTVTLDGKPIVEAGVLK